MSADGSLRLTRRANSVLHLMRFAASKGTFQSVTELPAEETIDDEIDGAVKSDHDVADVGQKPPIPLEVAKIPEAHLYGPDDVRRHGNRVTAETDDDDGDDDDGDVTSGRPDVMALVVVGRVGLGQHRVPVTIGTTYRRQQSDVQHHQRHHRHQVHDDEERGDPI